MLDVLVMKVMRGLVTVILLLQVKVLVKVLVEFVVEVLLFSLSSTTFPRTRPAARVWAWDAKGSGFEFAAPAPGRRCSGPSTELTPSNQLPGIVITQSAPRLGVETPSWRMGSRMRVG
jgi:hypothetical protein